MLQKIVYFIFSAMIALFSCKGLKVNSNKSLYPNDKETSLDNQTKMQLSTFARLFILELNNELSTQNTTIEYYKPSKKIIEEYGIQLFNKEYFLQGFATINNQIDHSELNKLGITLARPFGNKATIRIPLKSFNHFLHLNGIEYFEMNPKSELK